MKDNIEEKPTKGFTRTAFEIEELFERHKKLQEMFDMQVKLVTALELEKMELQSQIDMLWSRVNTQNNDIMASVKCELDSILDLVKENEQSEPENLKLAEKIKYLELENKEFEKAIHHQTKKVGKLELENEELRKIIESLTKGKLPCKADHNGECLVCDNWTCDCPLIEKII